MTESSLPHDSTSDSLTVPRWRRMIGWGILLICAGWMVRFVLMESSQSHPRQRTLVTAREVSEFAVAELGHRWRRDSNSLLQVFQNRRIIVRGKVIDFFKNRDDDYLQKGLLISSDSPDTLPLFCDVNDTEPWLMAQPCQEVSIRGCFGCEGTFELSQCEIVSVSGPSCPELTSNNLANFRQEPPRKGWVRVLGAINIIQPAVNRDKSPAIIEVATAGRPIKCRYQWGAVRQPLPGEKGQVMEFLGQLSQENDVDLIHCVRLDDPSDDELDPMAGKQPVPAYHVTPTDLHDAWGDANPYFGNWLELTGTVEGLGRFSDGPFLSIGDDDSNQIRCVFTGPSPWLVAKPGQSVRVIGLARHPVELRHCRFVEVSGEPTHAFTPDELVRIFLDKTSDELIPNDHVVCQGIVTEVSSSEDDNAYSLVTLKLSAEYDGYVFVCHFDRKHSLVPTEKEIGKTITVYGEPLGRTIQLLGRVMMNQPIWIDPEEPTGATQQNVHAGF